MPEIESGAKKKAWNIAEDLGDRVKAIHQAYANLVGGYLFLKKGDMAKALKSCKAAQAIVDTWLGRFALGKAYLDGGAFAEADSEFEECQKRKGEAMSVFQDDLPSFHYLDTLSYYLGRVQEGQGNKNAAKKLYEHFLAIKSKSDHADALISDAHRRLQSDNPEHSEKIPRRKTAQSSQ